MIKIKGKIKFYKKENNFGFIIGEDGNEYYFNNYSLLNNYIPKKDDKVIFKEAKGKKSTMAKEILPQ